MTELTALTNQRDEILAKIREIEETCEGIENENNSKRVQELNLEQAQYTTQKNELSTKISEVNSKLSAISSEISTLSSTGIDRILEAIKNQRWYFFKNKPKVLMDRDTGILWANINYYNIGANDNCGSYSSDADYSVVKTYDFDGFTKWDLPTRNEFIKMIDDKTFSFHKNASNHFIKDHKGTNRSYFRLSDYTNRAITLWDTNLYAVDGWNSHWLPCTHILVENTDYENNVSPNNPVYTEKERLQFTLDLFVQNDLEPIFNNDEITQLYKIVFFEKPALVEQLQELQSQIDSLQSITLLSAEFDYTNLLSKYDIQAIDKSVIKYYQAIQQWISELLGKLSYYENVKADTINEVNTLNLLLTKEYDYHGDTNFTTNEKKLLDGRTMYFQKKFTLNMEEVKSKLLSVKSQADFLEQRLNTIDCGNNQLVELANLENEKRASFSFVAENTAKILKNALINIEYFEKNRKFVEKCIQIWQSWTDDYVEFKTNKFNKFVDICTREDISLNFMNGFLDEWHHIRFIIEEKVLPIIDYGLRNDIPMNTNSSVSIVEQLLDALKVYKDNVDRFYLEQRVKLYKDYLNQPPTIVREKFAVESILMGYVFNFQSLLQEVLFECVSMEDRVFILDWINSILDINIDNILQCLTEVGINNVSTDNLKDFSKLKVKDFNAYLTDVTSYNKEKSNREKQFNAITLKLLNEVSDNIKIVNTGNDGILVDEFEEIF